MFVTRLANSFGLMNRGAWNFMTLIPTPPFNPILFRRARIIEDYGGGHYAIPNDDPIVGPEAPGRRVRSRRERDVEDEPPVIPVENEDVPIQCRDEADAGSNGEGVELLQPIPYTTF
ncbi:hypothetical protein Lser_V15G17608 [Lactuca serriola]